MTDPLSMDDLFKQMEEDEKVDRVNTQTKATPIDYARARGIRPQKVYAALRNGKLVWDSCECGRRVIVIAEADDLFNLQIVDSETDGDTEPTGADDE
jgi:hypothetical protein